jgi:GAF domain-containing protein
MATLNAIRWSFHLSKSLVVRSVLGVPMLKDDVLVGAFFIYRDFGAQAVIAIENTRLLNELRESLRICKRVMAKGATILRMR